MSRTDTCAAENKEVLHESLLRTEEGVDAIILKANLVYAHDYSVKLRVGVHTAFDLVKQQLGGRGLAAGFEKKSMTSLTRFLMQVH